MNANLYAAPATPLFLSPRVEVIPDEITLSRTQIFSTRSIAGQTIRVVEGMLWVTEEGDAEDHLLCTGESFRATGCGRIVVESLAPASRFVMGRR